MKPAQLLRQHRFASRTRAFEWAIDELSTMRHATGMILSSSSSSYSSVRRTTRLHSSEARKSLSQKWKLLKKAIITRLVSNKKGENCGEVAVSHGKRLPSLHWYIVGGGTWKRNNSYVPQPILMILVSFDAEFSLVKSLLRNFWTDGVGMILEQKCAVLRARGFRKCRFQRNTSSLLPLHDKCNTVWHQKIFCTTRYYVRQDPSM